MIVWKAPTKKGEIDMANDFKEELFYRTFLHEILRSFYNTNIMTNKYREKDGRLVFDIYITDEMETLNTKAFIYDSNQNSKKHIIYFEQPLDFALAKIEISQDIPNLLTVRFFQKNQLNQIESHLTMTEMYFTDFHHAMENGFDLSKNIYLDSYCPDDSFYFQQLHYHLNQLDKFIVKGNDDQAKYEKEYIQNLNESWIESIAQYNQNINDIKQMLKYEKKFQKIK